jgi:hypothetical protein
MACHSRHLKKSNASDWLLGTLPIFLGTAQARGGRGCGPATHGELRVEHEAEAALGNGSVAELGVGGERPLTRLALSDAGRLGRAEAGKALED